MSETTTHQSLAKPAEVGAEVASAINEALKEADFAKFYEDLSAKTRDLSPAEKKALLLAEIDGIKQQKSERTWAMGVVVRRLYEDFKRDKDVSMEQLARRCGCSKPFVNELIQTARVFPDGPVVSATWDTHNVARKVHSTLKKVSGYKLTPGEIAKRMVERGICSYEPARDLIAEAEGIAIPVNSAVQTAATEFKPTPGALHVWAIPPAPVYETRDTSFVVVAADEKKALKLLRLVPGSRSTAEQRRKAVSQNQLVYMGMLRLPQGIHIMRRALTPASGAVMSEQQLNAQGEKLPDSAPIRVPEKEEAIPDSENVQDASELLNPPSPTEPN